MRGGLEKDFDELDPEVLAEVGAEMDSEGELRIQGEEEFKMEVSKGGVSEGSEAVPGEEFRRMSEDELRSLPVEKWIRVLYFVPERYRICDFTKFSGQDWVKLLILRPYFRGICEWEKLSEADWRDLMGRRKGFEKIYAEKKSAGEKQKTDSPRTTACSDFG